MRRVLRFFAVLLAIGLAAPALAQVQTGSIFVRATDESGAVMPGVTITISSPVLVAGTMTAVTDSGGIYRFPSLVPGIYSVKVELSGFQTVTRQDIAVLVGQTTPVEFGLKVASLAESITVTGASPVIDTTSANQNVTLSEQLIQGTPGGRDIWALVEAKVPGLTISRPDVGGTSGGLQGVFSARGTTSAQNTSFLNGINVGDPAAIGAAGFYYDIDAFDSIQVSTGSHDITVPTSGVFLNMVTKTGGNKWNGGATFTWTGDGLQGRNDTNPDLQKYGFRPNGNISDFVSDVNITGGGPLIQNKLRFFGAFRDWRVHTFVPVQNSEVVLDQTNITSGLGNFTWQASPNNRLTGFYSRQRYDKPNRLLNNASITVTDSTSNEQDMFDLFQVQWNTVIGKNFFLDARGGLNSILFPTYQNGGNQQSVTDNATGIVYGNFPTDVIRNRDRYQMNATGQYYIEQALGGRHELRFGFDNTHAVTQNETTRVDDIRAFYNSTLNPRSVSVEIYATPLIDLSALDVFALYLQDSYSVNRLTLTGGLRYERLEGYLPEQNSPPSVYYPTLQRSFAEQSGIVVWNTAGPRASAVYDLSGNGKTALKGAYGRYYYILSTGGGGVSNVNPNANYFTTFTWNDANNDLKFQNGEQTGAGVLTSGTTTSIDPNFSRPYTDEYTFGVDRELMANFKMSAGFSYRRERNLQASANPDNAYATTTTSAVDPGIDGVVGTSDDGTYNFYQRISAANRTLITNDPTVVQSFKGFEISLTKRFSDRWQMLAGLGFSDNRLDHVSIDTSPNLLINANGNVTAAANADKPVGFKLTGMYILPYRDIILSGNLRTGSGGPVTRQISRGLAIGGAQTINLEPLGNSRMGALTVVDLRVGKQFTFPNSRTLEASIDFDNMFNADTTWGVRTLTPATTFTDPTTGTRQTLQQFMSPTQILVPRTVVLRAAFKF